MLITCSHCKSQYRVQADVLGPGGRKVRCGGCGALWLARNESPGPTGRLPVEDVPQSARRLPVRSAWMGRRAAPAAACMGLIMCGTALIAGRAQVMAAVPASASLFAVLGLHDRPALELRDLKTVETTENGKAQLIISGTIANRGTATAAVPILRFSVRESGGGEVYAFTRQPAQSGLAGGEQQGFWARLETPPPEGRAVAVRFARPDETPLLAAKGR